MHFNINNMSSFALWKSILRLVIVRIIGALHNNLKEVDIVGQHALQEPNNLFESSTHSLLASR